jgi:hypothetical protein
VLEQALEGRPAVVDLPPETLLILEGRDSLNDGDTITRQVFPDREREEDKSTSGSRQ